MKLKCYEVTFGNPRAQSTTCVTVSAPDENAAIQQAKLDAKRFGLRGTVSAIKELPPIKTP